MRKKQNEFVSTKPVHSSENIEKESTENGSRSPIILDYPYLNVNEKPNIVFSLLVSS